MQYIWNNLIDNKCPKCRCGLVIEEEIVECGNPKCRFKTTELELRNTIRKLHAPIKKRMFEHTEEENLEELNKL